MKRIIRTSSERLNDVFMSEQDRARAKTYLRGIEALVDLIWRAAAKIRPAADTRSGKSACRPA